MQFDGILNSNIFFFVTTIAVAALTALGVIIAVYMIKILRDVRWLMRSVKWRYRFIQKFIKSIIK